MYFGCFPFFNFTFEPNGKCIYLFDLKFYFQKYQTTKNWIIRMRNWNRHANPNHVFSVFTMSTTRNRCVFSWRVDIYYRVFSWNFENTWSSMWMTTQLGNDFPSASWNHIAFFSVLLQKNSFRGSIHTCLPNYNVLYFPAIYDYLSVCTVIYLSPWRFYFYFFGFSLSLSFSPFSTI